MSHWLSCFTSSDSLHKHSARLSIITAQCTHLVIGSHPLRYAVDAKRWTSRNVEHQRGLGVAHADVLRDRLVQVYDEPGHQYRRESIVQRNLVSIM